MKLQITYGDKYGPAMQITKQAEADAYFAELVKHNLKSRRAEGEPLIRAEAEKVERCNLGYWAGYFDYKTRERVERLFKCSHPVFGAIAEKGAPTTERALNAGIAAGMIAGGG